MEHIELFLEDENTEQETTETTEIITDVSTEDADNQEAPNGESESEEGKAGSEEDDSVVDLKPYMEFLLENNLLVKDDEDEIQYTEEYLEKLTNKTREKLAEQAINSLSSKINPNFHALLEYAMTPGATVDGYLQTFSGIPDGIDIENEDHQRYVLFRYYQVTTDFTDEKIDKLLSKLEQTADLKEETLDAISYLKEWEINQKTKLLEQEREREAQQVEVINKARKEILDTIEKSSLPKNRQAEIKDLLFSEQRMEDGTAASPIALKLDNILNTPQHLLQLAEILIDYSYQNGFDFSTLKKKLGSQAVNDFKKTLKNTFTTPGAGVAAPVKDAFDWDKFFTN
jgi:hypothetical protein